MYFAVRIALVSLLLAPALGQVVFCYYGSWAVYRSGNGLFDPEHLDPTICTHIIYAFLGLTANGSVEIFDPWADLPSGKDGFGRFVALKEQSPSTKVMISIGGWNEASTNFSPMVTDSTTRAAFVQNVVAFLKTYNFDGFDVDWEYPARRGGVDTDVENFVLLLKELKEAFEDDGYILTASVSSTETAASISYDIPNVSKYVDYIGLMTYDLHGSWDSVVGINAPLFPASFETTADELQLNVDACVTFWLNNGADPKKLVLGIPLYGRTFTLSNSENNTPGSAASGAGTAGPYTQEAGFIGYNELCEKNLTEEWTTVWFDEQKVPYAYYGNQWVGYDNEESVAIKTEYAISRELAGVMFWSVETDDFRAICQDTTFPLIRTAYNILLPSSETTSHPDAINGDDDNNHAVDDNEEDDEENDEHDDDTEEDEHDDDTEEDDDDTEEDDDNDQSEDNSEENASNDNSNEVTTSEDTNDVTISSSTLHIDDDDDDEVTTVTQSTTTEAGFITSTTICTADGYHRHETDCTKFWQCVGLATGGYIAYLLECPDPLVFDITLNVCNWASAVDC